MEESVAGQVSAPGRGSEATAVKNCLAGTEPTGGRRRRSSWSSMRFSELGSDHFQAHKRQRQAKHQLRCLRNRQAHRRRGRTRAPMSKAKRVARAPSSPFDVAISQQLVRGRRSRSTLGNAIFCLVMPSKTQLSVVGRIVQGHTTDKNHHTNQEPTSAMTSPSLTMTAPKEKPRSVRIARRDNAMARRM